MSSDKVLKVSPPPHYLYLQIVLARLLEEVVDRHVVVLVVGRRVELGKSVVKIQQHALYLLMLLK